MKAAVTVAVALLLVLACGVSASFAGDASTGAAKVTLSLTEHYTSSPWTSETGYGAQAGGKLLFGVKNLLLGWTDLFTEPHEAVQSGEGIFRGLGYGLKDTIENELGGAVHLVTFFLPQIDAPLPEGGVKF